MTQGKKKNVSVVPNEEMERGRNYVALLYPLEDETHNGALMKIRTAGYEYAAICHDRDTWTEADEKDDPEKKAGELKKAHTHIVLHFGNARYKNALAKELGITPNYLRVQPNMDSALKYLIHFHNHEKVAYEVGEVEGPLVARLAKLVTADEDEGMKVCKFLDLVDSIDGPLSYAAVLRMASQNGCYSEVRRAGSWLMGVIRQHNNRFGIDTNEIEA